MSEDSTVSRWFTDIVGPTIAQLVSEQRHLKRLQQMAFNGLPARQLEITTARQRIGSMKESLALVLPNSAMRSLEVDLDLVRADCDLGVTSDRVMQGIWGAYDTEESRDLRVAMWRLDASIAE